MYHIKPDKRSETSAALLCDALMAELKEREFDEITITSLVRRAMVGRSTFYRNFDEIIDILSWKCDQQAHAVLSGYSGGPQPDRLGLLEYVFGYWQAHADVLEALLRINRIDVIFDSFDRNADEAMARIREHIDLPQAQEKYFLLMRIGVFTGVLQTWLRSGKQETAAQLAAMLADDLTLAASRRVLF